MHFNVVFFWREHVLTFFFMVFTVLKIMMLHKNGFVEVANLCGKNKKVNLDYSITDVQWEPNGGISLLGNFNVWLKITRAFDVPMKILYIACWKFHCLFSVVYSATSFIDILLCMKYVQFLANIRSFEGTLLAFYTSIFICCLFSWNLSFY